MRRPLIGLPGRRKAAGQVAGFPTVLADLDIDVYIADYGRAVAAAGGIPVNLPFDVDPGEIVDRLDGLLLTGGADIAPARYGAEPETDEFPPEAIRDDFELGLLDAASAARLPTLGICRGIQLMNVHEGGTLHQHVPTHAAFDLAPDTELHDVTFTEGSTLRGLYGPHRRVNSLHHQTLDAVADALAVTGVADDGVVEGVEHRSLPAVAVQWHPEMMRGAANDPVFAWLVDAASAAQR